MHTECGIFATMGYQIPPAFIDNGMRKIQHRGQDSFGMISVMPQSGLVMEIKEFGLLPDTDKSQFIVHHNDAPNLDFRYGSGVSIYRTPHGSETLLPLQSSPHQANLVLVLGHTRYSTVAATIDKEAVQPIELSADSNRPVYIAFNGNLPNVDANMRRVMGITELEGSSDTFLFRAIWQKLAAGELTTCLSDDFARYCIQQIPGAYSCVVLVGNKLIGFRDRYGYKPLWYYRDSVLGLQGFVSETCQLTPGTSCQIREVPAGGIVVLADGAEPIVSPVVTISQSELSRCSMEAIYFMQDSSLIRYDDIGDDGCQVSVRDIKYRLGQVLAREELVCYSESGRLESSRAQVIYVPESSYPLAVAYANEMGFTFTPGVITKIYNIRSFIENNTEARVGKIKRKFEFDFSLITAPEVVIIDDSLVRGNTMKYIIGRLRESRPELKIHIRIASPIIKDKCWFGIDIAEHDELIWWQTGAKLDSLQDYLKVASIHYLSVDGLMSVLGPGYCGFCFGAGSQANQKTLEW